VLRTSVPFIGALAEALRAPANNADLLAAPLVRARNAREQADATGASCPAPRAGPDGRAADPRCYGGKWKNRKIIANCY